MFVHFVRCFQAFWRRLLAWFLIRAWIYGVSYENFPGIAEFRSEKWGIATISEVVLWGFRDWHEWSGNDSTRFISHEFVAFWYDRQLLVSLRITQGTDGRKFMPILKCFFWFLTYFFVNPQMVLPYRDLLCSREFQHKTETAVVVFFSDVFAGKNS